jgi:hypothetical protein
MRRRGGCGILSGPGADGGSQEACPSGGRGGGVIVGPGAVGGVAVAIGDDSRQRGCGKIEEDQ